MSQELSTLLAMHSSLNLGIFDLTIVDPDRWNIRSYSGDLLFHYWKVSGQRPPEYMPPSALTQALRWSYGLNEPYSHAEQRRKKFSKRLALEALTEAIRLEEAKTCRSQLSMHARFLNGLVLKKKLPD